MLDHCDICGIAALESQEFRLHRPMFGQPRRECPTCYDKRNKRALLCTYAIVFLFGFISIGRTFGSQTPFLDRPGIALMFFFVLQVAIVLPHELGHALVARRLQFNNVRIMIGSGRVLLTTKLFGFPIIFNRVPFGGLTLLGPLPSPNTRKSLAVVAAGPIVNLVIIVIVSPFISWRGFFDGTATWPELIFWSNALVLVVNLIPHTVSTSYGMVANDGLQIWRLLTRLPNPTNRGTLRISRLELALCHALKWLILSITSATSIFLARGSVWLVRNHSAATSPTFNWTIGLIVMALAILVGWITIRIYQNPISLRRPQRSVAHYTTQQLELVKKGNAEYAGKDYAEAERTFDQAMSLIQDRNLPEFAELYLAKLKTHIQRGEADRAEELCLQLVTENLHKEQKIRVLDGLAYLFLSQPSSLWLHHAERLARKSLDLTPGQPTLKATLGGVLTEQGKFSEAEPFLRECLDQSHAIDDQAISSFYLGWINAASGNCSEGQRLIKYAMIALPEPWLIAKGRNLLDKAKTITR
jgi:tetratricopeptide (TPR) repeat protein